MSAIRSLILHNDNIRLPPTIPDVHVIHVLPVVSGHEIKQQAIVKYQLQHLADSEPHRIAIYANPFGSGRLRVDTLETVPPHITDLYIRITSLAPAVVSP